ncbi:MAG: SDR family oxidoreductase [Pseudomonadota bacterium]
MAERPLAVLTGASAGIGAELAREIARDGYDLLLVARRGDRLAKLAESLSDEFGVTAQGFSADLSTPDGPAAVEEALSGLGREAEVLINNAGIGGSGPFANRPAGADLSMLDLNVRAVVDLTHRLLPPMVARRSGGVLNVASLAAFQPGPNAAVYYATKSFVLSFSQALHSELRSKGVCVSALCPGPVDTEFFQNSGMDDVLLRRVAPAIAAKTVAAAGWRGFRKGKRVIFPDIASTFRAVAGSLTPNAVVLPVVRKLHSKDRAK